MGLSKARHLQHWVTGIDSPTPKRWSWFGQRRSWRLGIVARIPHRSYEVADISDESQDATNENHSVASNDTDDKKHKDGDHIEERSQLRARPK
jgi:hypothetical protein